MLSLVIFFSARANYKVVLPAAKSPQVELYQVIRDACSCGLGSKKPTTETLDSGTSPSNSPTTQAPLISAPTDYVSTEAPITHWLENARRYGHDEKSIHMAKGVMKILPIFCALPIFWTLYDQQGSAVSRIVYH